MKKLLLIFSLLIAFSSFAVPLLAQDSATLVLNNLSPEPEEINSKMATPLSRLEFLLSLAVLAFGLLIILLEVV